MTVRGARAHGVAAMVMGMALLGAGNARAETPDANRPYTWQRFGAGPAWTGTVAAELGYGTRDSRFFGADGFEQGVALRLQSGERVAFEAYGGALFSGGDDPRPGVAGGLVGRVLTTGADGVDLDLGAGWGYDFRARHVLRARAALGRAFGRWDLRIGSVVEVPVTGEGDSADLMLSVAGSVRLAPGLRQGLELGVEDVEGFWEAEEAEGGARLVAGPTTYVQLGDRVELRVNVAVVYAPGPLDAPVEDPWGFMGRASVAYTFGDLGDG